MSNISQKIFGLNKPTIWTKMSELAIKTNSLNLGQGFPSWDPPKEFLNSLQEHQIMPGMNQYSPAFGNVSLKQSLASFYSNIFHKTIDPLSEICITTGGVAVLFNAINGLAGPGDEVVAIEPAYDCYLGQVQISGATYKGVPLIPPKPLSKKELKDRLKENNEIIFKRDEDSWKVDFELLKSTITDKTRILILNSPHNPTGKIFTQQEYEEIAKIIEKYPKVTIISDEVYEFNLYEDIKVLPRFANLKNMWERTITVLSAGKTFQATGIRIGFGIGPKNLIDAVKAVHQYSAFCLYNPLQLAVKDAYDQFIINKESTYIQDLVDKYKFHRYELLKMISEQNYDFQIYLPESGYFLLLNIQNIFDHSNYKKEDISNDLAFCTYLAEQKKVVFIPCSVFYCDENKSKGINYVRVAYCKTIEMIKQAGVNLN